jgi:hypothetical protein
MAEILALLRPPGDTEHLRDWIVAVIIRVGAIPTLALLIAALWVGIGVWTIPVVVAVGAAIVAVMHLRRRERELAELESEIMREEFERTAREVSEVRAAWGSGGAPDAPGPGGEGARFGQEHLFRPGDAERAAGLPLDEVLAGEKEAKQ